MSRLSPLFSGSWVLALAASLTFTACAAFPGPQRPGAQPRSAIGRPTEGPTERPTERPTQRAIPTRRVDAAPVVFRQAPIGSMACGPCSFYNALVAGTPGHRAAARSLAGTTHEEKIRSFIADYGEAPSEVYVGRRQRYDVERGTPSGDLAGMANAFLADRDAPLVEGRWLKRLEGETQDEQLRRIHRALESAPLPPVIEVRSFHADVKKRGAPLWEGLFGHYLVVRSVDPLPENEDPSGFLMRCADSYTGRIIPVFASIERFRPYTATDGFTVDEKGKEQWHWAPNSPYLLLTAPDLSLRTQRADWYERSIMTMTWGLFPKTHRARAPLGPTRSAAKAARTGGLRSSR